MTGSAPNDGPSRHELGEALPSALRPVTPLELDHMRRVPAVARQVASMRDAVVRFAGTLT